MRAYCLPLLMLAACDSGPVAVIEPVETRSITYRVETDPPVSLRGVTYLTSATQLDPDLSGEVQTPWEVTVPYFDGLKNVSTAVLNADAELSILVDGEIVARNLFSGDVGAETEIIVGAVAGLPRYDVRFILSALAPDAELEVRIDGAAINSYSEYQETVSDGSRTIQGGRAVNPGETITFVKGAIRGILGVNLHPAVGYVRHIYSVTTSERIEMDFTFDFDEAARTIPFGNQR